MDEEYLASLDRGDVYVRPNEVPDTDTDISRDDNPEEGEIQQVS